MMTSIIAEVRGNNQSNVETKIPDDVSVLEYGHCALSPVYSVQSPVYESEDKRCFYKETIDNDYIANNIDTIDLCSYSDNNEELPTVPVQKEKPIFNLLKCISNMSIRDNENLKPCNDLNLHNSPSILADTPHVSDAQNLTKTNKSINNITKNATESSLTNLKIPKVKPIQSFDKDTNNCMDNTVQMTKVSDKNSEIKERHDNSSNLPQLNKKHADEKVTFVMSNLCNRNRCEEESNTIATTQKYTKTTETNAVTNISYAENPNTMQPKMVSNLKENKNISFIAKATLPKNIYSIKTKAKVNKNVVQKKVIKPRKNTKPKNIKASVPKNALIKNSDEIKNTSVTTFKKVEVNIEKKKGKKVPKPSKVKTNLPGTNFDNLSWLTSIRYIREVDSNEYETRLYDANFWDDFTFPNDINAQDFLI